MQTVTDDIANRFTEVFRQHLWNTFEQSGLPAEQMPLIAASLEELGPLAEGVVLLQLRQSIQAAAQAFLDEQADRLGITIPPPGDSAEPPTTR